MDEEKYEKRQDYDLSQIIQAESPIRPAHHGPVYLFMEHEEITEIGNDHEVPYQSYDNPITIPL